MRNLIKKVSTILGIIISFLGISTRCGQSITVEKTDLIKENTPLYLEHASNIHKDFFDNSIMLTWHESHYSHYSHESHYSHYSHYSHESHYSHYSSW
jgi:hypothetical protein